MGLAVEEGWSARISVLVLAMERINGFPAALNYSLPANPIIYFDICLNNYQ